MRKSKFAEEQIAYALRQVESGSPPVDVCRHLGVSDATFDIWKKKYAHLGVSELRKLRALEDENARLKRLVADLSLDKHILTEALRKKSLRPTQRRELAVWVQTAFAASCVRACHLAQFSRTAWYRRSTRDDQAALRSRIRELAQRRRRFGFTRIWVRLRREGWPVNRNAFVGCTGWTGCSCGCECVGANTSRCIAGRRRLRSVRRSAGAWTSFTTHWPMDARFEYSEVDQWSRQSPILEAASSMSGHTVGAALDRVLAGGRGPRSITVDHGTEFMSRALEDWAYQRGVQLDFIRPGNPWKMPSSSRLTDGSATSV